MLPSVRTDSAQRSLAAAIAVAPLGFLGGLVVLTAFFGMFEDDVEGPPEPTPAWIVIGMAAVVTVLSAAAGSVGGRSPEPSEAARRGVIAAMLAAGACGPVTFIPVMVLAFALNPSLEGLGGLCFGVVVVTTLGAVVGFFLGIPFAATYAVLLAAMAHARERGGHAHAALVWLVVGAAWTLAGALTAACSERWWSAGVVVALAGVALGAAALARVARLVRWVRRAGRGEIPGYETRPATAEDVRLPLVVPALDRGQVLVRIAHEGSGPFRSQDTAEHLARC